MDRKLVIKQYNAICKQVAGGKLKSALDGLSLFIRNVSTEDLFYRLETITDNYRNLLKYSFEGYTDPKRDDILAGISAEVLLIADEVRYLLTDKDMFQRRVETSIIRQEFGDEPERITERLEEFVFGKEIQRITNESGTQTMGNAPIDSIFRLIWLTRKMNDQHAELFREMATSGRLEWQEKCIVVSALTMSLLTCFDHKKVMLLLDFIQPKQPQVYQRALTGLVLSLIRYDHRIRFYPVLISRIDEISSDDTIRQDVEAIILQLLMAQETENITRAFREEVLPDMEKVMPKMEDKLQLENILEDDDPEGKNPGWKDLIDEVPGLFERIEKFTKMQIEGGDVFMATFSLLKRFDFFNSISNWFAPFYITHPELRSSSGENSEYFDRLLEGLARAFYLCNSDKYSFALNFNAVPQQQRSMIITYFEAELEQMKEMATEEEVLGQSAASHSIFIQYIQDLYRFFKLYPHHDEFEDIFHRKIRFTALYFYHRFFERASFTEQLATFYFEKEHYPEVIELYRYIIEKNPPQAVYYEKLGFALQKTGDLEEAIEAYKKAELFDTDHLWILKKLGWCCMKIKDYPSAARYFSAAANLRPDDLKLQAQLGQCYLNMKQFEPAFQHYTQVQYYQPDNLKVLRPIAYCQFVLGKLQDAESIYRDILASETVTGYDYINAAHVALCLGKRSDAILLYRKCFTDPGFSEPLFLNAFEEDAPILVSNGISEREVQLIADHLIFGEY